jgi:threonine dehydrogenase-like Zn-dependent dehydrogenase
MRAITMRADRFVDVEDVPEPSPGDGDLLVEAVAVGVCGTDRWLLQHDPSLPPGSDRLVLGHESLGRVLYAPPGSGFEPGNSVVGMVRRADPVPCRACVAGDLDLCENGAYSERGIVRSDGFASERYALLADEAVRVDPALGLGAVLIEPTSVVAKAWEQIDRVARCPVRRVLVFGAGPIGLLAALIGVQRGCEVHVHDQIADGPKPIQARTIGAFYHPTLATLDAKFDAVLECTGALVGDAITMTAAGGTTCLVGLGQVQAGSLPSLEAVARAITLQNKVVAGINGTNRRHFESAHEVLRRADRSLLLGLLGPCVKVDDWRRAMEAPPSAIKPVIRFGDA